MFHSFFKFARPDVNNCLWLLKWILSVIIPVVLFSAEINIFSLSLFFIEDMIKGHLLLQSDSWLFLLFGGIFSFFLIQFVVGIIQLIIMVPIIYDKLFNHSKNVYNFEDIKTDFKHQNSIINQIQLTDLTSIKFVDDDQIRKIGTLFFQWSTKNPQEFPGPQNSIYAVDRSSPNDWWGNGMAAYQGLLNLWEKKVKLCSLQLLSKTKKISDYEIEADFHTIKIKVKDNSNGGDIKPLKQFINCNLQTTSTNSKKKFSLCKYCGRINRIYIWPLAHIQTPLGANIIAADRYQGHEVYILPLENLLKTDNKNLINIEDFLLWDIGKLKPNATPNPDSELACYGMKEIESKKEDSKQKTKKTHHKRELDFISTPEAFEDYKEKWLSLRDLAHHIDDIVIPFQKKGTSLADSLRENIESVVT